MFMFFLNIYCHIFFGMFLIMMISPFCLFFLMQINFNFMFELLIPFSIICCLFWSFIVINPMNTLLLILISFILTSLLLFKISIEILTYIFLIVYIGALMMLFLFVMMLFNLQQMKQKMNLNLFFIMKILIFFIIFFTCFKNIYLNLNYINFNIMNYFSSIFYYTNLTTNGNRSLFILYTVDANIFLILLTILLLYTMLGAIILALSTKKSLN